MMGLPEITEAVLNYYPGLSSEDIHGWNRQPRLVEARRLCWLLARSELITERKYSFKEIGEYYCRDHSAICQAVKVMKAKFLKDKALSTRCRKIVDASAGRAEVTTPFITWERRKEVHIHITRKDDVSSVKICNPDGTLLVDNMLASKVIIHRGDANGTKRSKRNP